MVRRTSFAALLAILFSIVAIGAWPGSPDTSAPAAMQQASRMPAAVSGPVKLARHPDYHAGKIAFSYLGDIWTADENGSDAHRITDHSARDVYPRFSPDGRWIAFSSNRYGGYDVFVMPATGGAPRRLTFHSGGDDVVGWTRDSQQVIFRSSRGDGAFPSVATLYQIAVTGGQEKPLPVDWGYSGDYSPDGKSLVFNRHPSTWSRKHYRGSYAADIWIADLGAKTYRQLLADQRYNRFWPMWGADDSIYFVADPLPNDSSVKPGSPEVRRSTNNIYKVSSRGGEPVQVTKHTDGSLFWPSMSSDGKVIVYENNFGVWKLDVASGRSNEIKIDIVSDEKENEVEYETVTNTVDAFDLSPSSRRAVISTRGQLLTIATDRGDITRVAPDPMASRNDQPKWSPDGKYIAFVSDRSGRDEVWISDPEGNTSKKITDLDNEKGALVWTPDSKALFYTAADKKLYSYSVADGKTSVAASSDLGRIGSVAVSPDSKWVMFSKQDRTLRSHVYIAPIAGGEERHVTEDRVHYSESNAVWTADGRYIVFTSTESTPTGIASQGGISSTTTLWATALRDRERDPADRDIDNEAEGLAADAAARQGGGRGGAAGTQPPVAVQIDFNGMGRRARQLTVPGNPGSPTPAPEGHSVALSVSSAAAGGGRGGGGADPNAGMYIINVESGQLTRVPQPPPAAAAAAGGRGRGRGGGGGGFGGGAMVFARDGRTLYFRSGTGLYAAPIGNAAAAATAAAGGGAGGGGGRGGRGGGGAATATEPAQTNQTARQVTYTANLEIDRRALRAQVFNEGWRIMKNRFYDAKMHGADWNAAKKEYEPLLQYLTDTEELHTIMMMMIGELNASHTGVSGGGGGNDIQRPTTRHPGFDVIPDASGYYKVGRIYKDGPADRDFFKISEGNYIIALDDRELKTSDNYWQRFTVAAGSKFHFLINDKPSKEGAWEVTITPVAGGALTDLMYRRWVDDRRDTVTKLSNGEIGYLHIRAMDAPSLRQFQLDLAANRTKKALVIDQRFNGGGGIDQELLGILAGRQYQYTVGRDQGYQQPRPQNFYGPMVVMQNERSASDAEMFPAGFKALGLGKVIGVPTMGAVIGTGSYTLLDGSTIRTPGSGVWTVTGENMENYGVPPDVYIDNTPAAFVAGHDLQIEKAVEVLKAEMAKKTNTASSSR
ncbi:MAG TPA: S41 family peptidase [Vicinamibacterales bacterium]|nr:S41 family peptidase [Vicinamibacterales bacterium]